MQFQTRDISAGTLGLVCSGLIACVIALPRNDFERLRSAMRKQCHALVSRHENGLVSVRFGRLVDDGTLQAAGRLLRPWPGVKYVNCDTRSNLATADGFSHFCTLTRLRSLRLRTDKLGRAEIRKLLSIKGLEELSLELETWEPQTMSELPEATQLSFLQIETRTHSSVSVQSTDEIVPFLIAAKSLRKVELPAGTLSQDAQELLTTQRPDLTVGFSK